MANNLSYSLSGWSLADLFQKGDEAEIKAALESLEGKIKEFEAGRPALDETISLEKFMQMVKQLEQITDEGNILYSFPGLWFASDTQNQSAQTLMARINQFSAEMTNRTLFFSLWWKALDDQNAQRLMAGAGDYRYWLEEMRHFKKYTLSEPEEKVINIKDVTGFSAFNTLYDSITNRYTFKVKIGSRTKALTRDSLMVYARHFNPQYRASAYRELYRVFGNDGNILGQIYQTIVRDWRNEQVNLRGFASPIAARNLVNDVPDDVVDTLLEVSRANASVFQRFFQLKARWIGMERLRRYDVYAPVAQSNKKYEFNQSLRMVMDSFSGFDPVMAQMVERVLKANHLDSQVRKGKRSGAFCWSVNPGMTPWVLVNFQGRVDDVETLAHEMGHAIHSMLAEHHTTFTFHASLPMAETASTFSEMLLVDQLLQNEPDETVRRDILFRQVDDAYATILRQAFFAQYERTAHDMVNQGASVDELSAAYMENLKVQFGDAVEINDEFRWEWVSIPHFFHVPFYVYAYSFGQLLVMSLYQQFKKEGQAFKPRYLKILSTGGSDAPVRTLAQAGIDVHQAAFWQGGFDVIRDLVEELERIPLPKK
jgi:oligoendopeptidase F